MESLQDKLAEADYRSLDKEVEILKNPPHGIKAILFDLDGVLVDGNIWHRKALVHALHDAGWDVSSDELAKFDGMTAADKLVELRKVGRAPSEGHKKIVEAKRSYMLKIIEEECRPIDRIRSAVSYVDLFMPCAVVTNCSRDAALLMIEKSGLKHLVSAVVTSDDVKGNVKPSPYPYMEASRKLGIFIRDCLIFDDTQRGITSAMEAGCKFRRVKSFDDLSVDYIYKTLNALRIRV